MQEAVQVLRELRASASVTEEQKDRLFELCRTLQVPRITIYSASRQCEGWFEMQAAYVFTERTDVHDFVWYFSPRRGLVVCRGSSDYVPFEEWDPQADLFTDDSMFEGGTNMNPFERESAANTA